MDWYLKEVTEVTGGKCWHVVSHFHWARKEWVQGLLDGITLDTLSCTMNVTKLAVMKAIPNARNMASRRAEKSVVTLLA